MKNVAACDAKANIGPDSIEAPPYRGTWSTDSESWSLWQKKVVLHAHGPG